MKTAASKPTDSGLTLVEVFVIILIIAGLIGLLIPPLIAAKQMAGKIQCVNNLVQVGLACRIWEEAQTNQSPPAVSINRVGTMESAYLGGGGTAFSRFLTLSNELTTPKILHCPADKHDTAIDFSHLTTSNISYFINLAVPQMSPQMILSGDANLMLNGTTLHTGVTAVSTNDTLSWTGGRHQFRGNIGLADGSVQQVTTNGLQMALQNSGPVTNQIALP